MRFGRGVSAPVSIERKFMRTTMKSRRARVEMSVIDKDFLFGGFRMHALQACFSRRKEHQTKMSGSCPLPQVQEALEPYIHTRQETLRIRQTLTKHLKSQFQDEAALTHLSIFAPSSSLEVNDTSSLPEGLYSQYLEALSAHRKAKEQYDALKAEIEDLRQSSNSARKTDPETGGSGISDHITLLRHRQQHQKLEIVQDALMQLGESEPNPVKLDLKGLLREQLGEPPEPPIEGIGPVSSDEKIDDLVFRLKKELLTARSQLDRANAEKADADTQTKSLPEPSTAAQVAALRAARDGLISWIEGELAKIPENEDAESSELSISQNGNNYVEPLSDDAISAAVQDRYDRYVEARKALIAQLEATSQYTCTAPAPLESQATSGASPKKTPVTQNLKATDILPHLPSLISASRDETHLLQQSSHLHRQLAFASEETSRTIQRLAGESYLVAPNATSMEAWAKAADDASVKTAALVEEQARVGEHSVESARDVLGVMKRRREASERLKGGL